jgi:hypothetical protein
MAVDGREVVLSAPKDVSQREGSVLEYAMTAQPPSGSWLNSTAGFLDDYSFKIISEQARGPALEWVMIGTTKGEGASTEPAPEPCRVRGAAVGRLDANGGIQGEPGPLGPGQP